MIVIKVRIKISAAQKNTTSFEKSKEIFLKNNIETLKMCQKIFVKHLFHFLNQINAINSANKPYKQQFNNISVCWNSRNTIIL
jgi:hypothetical protein